MLSGFKQFILRGNVVDMAVGVVVGAAFASVVGAFTKDLLTPLIAAIVGKPDFSCDRVHDQRHSLPVRRFHQCVDLVPAGSSGGLLLCGDTGEPAGHADAQGAGTG